MPFSGVLSAFASVVAGLDSIRPESVPVASYLPVIVGSALAHTALFVLLPATPWMPKVGGEKRGDRMRMARSTHSHE
jgi:hypothetical protein